MSGTVIYLIELLVNLFEAMVLGNFMGSTLTPKHKKLSPIVVIVLFFIISSSNVLIPNISVAMCVTFVCFFIVQCLFFNGSITRKVFYLALFTVINIICETVASFLLMSIFDISVDSMTSPGGHRMLGIIISKTLMFVLTTTVCKLQKNQKSHIPAKYWAALMVVPLTSILELVLLFSLDWNKIENSTNIILMMTVAIGIMFSNIFVFVVFEKLSNAIEAAETTQLMKQQMLMQESYFVEIQNSHQNLRSLWHDMNNHLETIRQMRGTGTIDEVYEYIDELTESLRSAQLPSNCGISIIDAVINDKYTVALDAGIDMRFRVAVASIYDIKGTDIGSLICNVLDNAIEACGRIKDESISRSIVFSVIEKEYYLVVSCINSISNEDAEKTDEHILVSTKENNETHGIGINNIRSIAQKYLGNMLTEHNSSTFSIIVILQKKKDD